MKNLCSVRFSSTDLLTILCLTWLLICWWWYTLYPFLIRRLSHLRRYHELKYNPDRSLKFLLYLIILCERKTIVWVCASQSKTYYTVSNLGDVRLNQIAIWAGGSIIWLQMSINKKNFPCIISPYFMINKWLMSGLRWRYALVVVGVPPMTAFLIIIL